MRPDIEIPLSETSTEIVMLDNIRLIESMSSVLMHEPNSWLFYHVFMF